MLAPAPLLHCGRGQSTRARGTREACQPRLRCARPRACWRAGCRPGPATPARPGAPGRPSSGWCCSARARRGGQLCGGGAHTPPLDCCIWGGDAPRACLGTHIPRVCSGSLRAFKVTQHTAPTHSDWTVPGQAHMLIIIAAQATPSSVEAQGEHTACFKNSHELTGGC